MAYLYHIAAWSSVLVVLGFGECWWTRKLHDNLRQVDTLMSFAAVYFARFRLFAILPERFQNLLLKASGSGNGSLYSRLPAYDWSTSRLAGLHSTLFDIEANMQDGDSRTGLEAGGAQEIERLMNTQGVVSILAEEVILSALYLTQMLLLRTLTLPGSWLIRLDFQRTTSIQGQACHWIAKL